MKFNSIFPPVDQASEEGIVAIGGDLTVETLYDAYTHGIFPWPISTEYPLAWFSPDPRGILEYKDLHISKSLQKLIKKNIYVVKMNHDFSKTINCCATSANRKNQKGTWITSAIIDSYIKMHQAGFAYSVEVYDQQNEMVGGIYGVCIGKYISGESMFYLKANGSKLALFYLMNFLHEKNINWIDTQMVSPVVKSMGGKEIHRDLFLQMLKKQLKES